MNYFSYNGVRSCDMGLRITAKNVFSAPEYDVTFQAIPGRNGDLILPNGRYPNVQVTYSVFLPARTVQELSEKITNVKAWLYAEQNSYHELTDTYDTSCYRKAVFASKLDIEDELNRIGVFTVCFSCKPFKYALDCRNGYTFSSSPFTITNPYIFESLPFIRINGTGSGTLTINSATWSFSELSGYIDCDSELMNFYQGTVLKNDKVVGNGFPKLKMGENNISFTGGITSVWIQPRWCTL